jgi:membrane associated rhomboid family serine protease
VAEFQDQTNSVCYGFQSAPTDQEFFDVVRGQSKYPADSTAQVLLSIVTALFMHAGWVHIIGNMLFLWVFGDNIEDRLGHIGYLAFYLAGGIFASLSQGFADPNSVVPNVGASGAVAAVLGAYLVFFPRATVNVVIPFFILIFIPIPIPAAVMIGLWFLQNLLAGVATVTTTTADQGVAFFAHIGGFLFGFLLTLLVFRPLLRRPPRYATHM